VLIPVVALVGVTWGWVQTSRAKDELADANNRARGALYRSTIAQSQLRWRTNDFTGANLLLTNWLKKFQQAPGQEDPRSWEWDYVRGLYESDLMTMKQSDGASGGLAVSPDGRWVASVVIGQREVRMWSTETGQQLFTVRTSLGAQRLAFRPDGQVLAVADNTGGRRCL
jgi:hypothetical protein